MFTLYTSSYKYIMFRFALCINKNKLRYGIRKLHNVQRFAFIVDNKYCLLDKMKQQNTANTHTEPMTHFPSSFSRNLLHPFSNHLVSQYACKYYQNATHYYGEFPLQFFASEMYHWDPSETDTQMKHSVVLYPEQIRISNIEKEHIPYITRLCSNENLPELINSNDSRIEKMDGINIYFFCDVNSLDNRILLCQWFAHCFDRSNYHKVSYIFGTGNFKNGQDTTVIIQKGDYRILLSNCITLKDIDNIVQHMISM